VTVFQFPLARELHDQNRVLRRKPDQHDEADLGENVVVRAHEIYAGDRSKQAHRHDQDYGERHGDALVKARRAGGRQV